MKGRKSGWEMNHKRLWTPGNKRRVLEGIGVGGHVSLMMGIRRAEIAWSTDIMCRIESWNTTSKTNDVLYGD